MKKTESYKSGTILMPVLQSSFLEKRLQVGLHSIRGRKDSYQPVNLVTIDFGKYKRCLIRQVHKSVLDSPQGYGANCMIPTTKTLSLHDTYNIGKHGHCMIPTT